MTTFKTAAILVALASGGIATSAMAQANGDPGSISSGAAEAQTKADRDASGANAMQKGRSGNSGPDAGKMGGSNAMSGSGQKPAH